MFSNQSILESVLGSSFGSHAFDRGIRRDFSSTFFTVSNDTLAIFGTAKFSGAGVTDSRALRRTLHSHALPSMSTADLISIGSLTVDDSFASLFILISSSVVKK